MFKLNQPLCAFSFHPLLRNYLICNQPLFIQQRPSQFYMVRNKKLSCAPCTNPILMTFIFHKICGYFRWNWLIRFDSLWHQYILQSFICHTTFSCKNLLSNLFQMLSILSLNLCSVLPWSHIKWQPITILIL